MTKPFDILSPEEEHETLMGLLDLYEILLNRMNHLEDVINAEKKYYQQYINDLLERINRLQKQVPKGKDKFKGGV